MNWPPVESDQMIGNEPINPNEIVAVAFDMDVDSTIVWVLHFFVEENRHSNFLIGEFCA